jgi:hypothetical protein
MQQSLAESFLPEIRRLDPRIFEQLAAAATPDSQGAIGRNRDGYVAVVFQREALTLIKAGIATQKKSYIEQGMRAIQYGFSHQRPDGSFETGRYHGQEIPAVDAASAASFFIGAVSVGCVFIEQSEFASQFGPEVERLRAKIGRAANWLKTKKELLRRYDQETANRLVFDALAFGVSGRLLKDPELETIGREFLEFALQKQREDGVFPEKGGHDSSYQAASLLMLQYYWLAGPSGRERERVFVAIRKGMAWEQSRIHPHGEVDSSGNTRTGGQEVFLGRSKDVNYREIVSCLALWAAITGEEPNRETAQRVLQSALARSGQSRNMTTSGEIEHELKEKREELIRLRKQKRLPKQATKRARSLYDEAEAAYKAGQHEVALEYLNRAIRTLKSEETDF